MFWNKFYRYKSILKRNWWIPFLTISISVAYQAHKVMQRPVEYQVTAQMMVSPRVNTMDSSLVSEEVLNFFGTQIKILESEVVIGRAHRRVQLENPKLQGTGVQVSVTQAPRSSIFMIVGRGSEPGYTQLFVNALMNEFIVFKREKRDETVDTTAQQLTSEMERIGKELKEHERKFYEFKERNNMAFWDEQGKESAKFLSQLKSKKTNLTAELQLLETMTEAQVSQRQRRQDQIESTNNPTSSADFVVNLQLQYLQTKQQLAQSRADAERMAQVLKPRHPKMIKLRDDVSRLERLIQVLEQQNKEATELQVANLKAENELRIKSLRTELKGVEESLKEWEEKALEASRKDADYQRLQSSVQRSKEVYDRLLGSVQSLDVGKKVNPETIQVMQWANPPNQLSRGIANSITSAFIMGLAIGILIIVGINKFDDRISSVSELYEQFNLPVLAQVPKMKIPTGAERLSLLQATDERKILAESYRNLRSSLLFLPGKQKLKSLIVTSSIPKEGKSTVSSNLAVTMALAETHVLLVDADLRLGHLANDFGLKTRVGLSDVLEKKLSWQEALLQTQYPHLHLLPCGAPMHTPGDYLLSEEVDLMMEQMKKHYSIVIFDTAPILAADDTASLAPRTDGVLMVFRADYTTARQAKYCIESLQQRQIDVLGMVLNGFSEDMPDYYYYRYKDYYNL